MKIIFKLFHATFYNSKKCFLVILQPTTQWSPKFIAMELFEKQHTRVNIIYLYYLNISSGFSTYFEGKVLKLGPNRVN